MTKSNETTKQDITRPITMYVVQVLKSNLDHIHTDRISIIDVEMSKPAAEELVKLIQDHQLQKRVVRFRLSGRLVLS